MITDVTRRASRSLQGENSPTTRLSGVPLYYDLARASGGQAVQVSKSDLPMATGIIEDSSAGAVVRAREADFVEQRPIGCSMLIMIAFLSSR